MTTIAETVSTVSEKHGITVRRLTRRGGSLKDARLVAIREEIVSAHPDAHPRELADALNLDRSSIYAIRDRLRRKALFVNSVNSSRLR